MHDPSGGRYYKFPLKGFKMVDGKYQEIDLTTEPDGVLKGCSDVLGVSVAWDDGVPRLYDHASGMYLESVKDMRRARRAAEAERDAEKAGREAAETRADAAEVRADAFAAQRDMTELQLESAIRTRDAAQSRLEEESQARESAETRLDAAERTAACARLSGAWRAAEREPRRQAASPERAAPGRSVSAPARMRNTRARHRGGGAAVVRFA